MEANQVQDQRSDMEAIAFDVEGQVREYQISHFLINPAICLLAFFALISSMEANQVQDQRSDMEAIAFDAEGQVREEGQDIKVVDSAKRAQRVMAALRGFTEGMLSMAYQVIMGDGAAEKDVETMILKGVTSLAAGACMMGVGEFLSVHSQYDINMAPMEGEGRSENMEAENMEKLPNPWQEAGASALAYAVGALVPLVGAAFVKDYGVRVGVVIGVVSFALFGFGGLCALLGKAPVVKSSLRMLVGGWLALGLPFGLTKLVGL